MRYNPFPVEPPLDCKYNCTYNGADNEHGCDFADAADIFMGNHLEIKDERRDYGEPRFIVMGYIKNRVMVAVYTCRGTETIRIISLRKANSREKERFESAVANRLGKG